LNGQEWRGEFQNRRKDGSIYWELASISPVKNASGKVTHLVAVKEDITERKSMEKDLIAAKEKAEESDNLKTSFLANLSHEIRTPMNGILGFSELLNDTDLEEGEFGRYVEIITSNGNQLLNIIDDIITISNLEVKQLKIRKHDIDLVSFLEDIRMTMVMEKKGLGKDLVQLDFPVFASGSNIINTDESKLNQVLTNLLKNALKFTEQGSIKLRFSRLNEHEIRFSVSDSGVGIPEEMLEVIFDRFRQVDESSTRNFGGTGLGLAISRGLVELLGGEIWVESELGKGATFHFSLKLN
jgi:signal transduction histidine kinase